MHTCTIGFDASHCNKQQYTATHHIFYTSKTHVSTLSHLQGHFQKLEAKLEAEAGRSLLPSFSEKRPMGWLRLVGSLKLLVSFAEYHLFYKALLQKRPMILRSLILEATSYVSLAKFQ